MKMLFLPHVPTRRLVSRVEALAEVCDGYLLDWEIANHSLSAKIRSQLRSLSRRVSVEGRTVTMPLLFKPEPFAPLFNTMMLNRIVRDLGIEVVVNANALLFDVERIAVPTIYDLVDDHLSPNPSIGLSVERIAKITRDLAAARGVVCVSDFLTERVRAINPRVATLENGIYPERFERARSLKERFGWEGKQVFGYIGGVEPWTGLDRACSAYEKIASEETAMLVVGSSPGRYYRDLTTRFGRMIRFVGAVPPANVADYFKTLDVGLIPFERNLFTDNSMPIKALEYGLGGARVLSTPLAYLRHKGFPFVTFASIDTFDRAMRGFAGGEEPEVFDFASCSWSAQGRRLRERIEAWL